MHRLNKMRNVDRYKDLMMIGMGFQKSTHTRN